MRHRVARPSRGDAGLLQPTKPGAVYEAGCDPLAVQASLVAVIGFMAFRL